MNILFFLNPKAETSYIYDDNTLRQGVEKARAHGYTATPVITRDGRYVGTVTQGDMLWAVLEKYNGDLKSLEKVKITDVMRDGFNPPVTVTTNVEELLQQIEKRNFVPVVDDRGAFIGIITRKSVINYLQEKQ